MATAKLIAIAEEDDKELKKLFRQVEKGRQQVLPPKVRKYLDKVASDPKASRKFLIDAGIVDKNGRLKQKD